MSYLESIATTATASSTPASREVVEHALSLRDSTKTLEASSTASHFLEISALSEENQHLFQTRIFGGLATKLALASYHSEAPSFYTLSDDDQLKELENLSSSYAADNFW